MIETIVHLSDVHIRNYLRLDEAKASMDRFLYDMEHVVHPDRIVITGDLVHAKNQPSPEAFDMTGWFLEECCRIAKTVYILGNHDLLEDNSDRMDAITPVVNRMRNPRLHFYKNSGTYQDENVIWVVFSIRDGEIPKVETKLPEYKYYGLFHGKIQGAKTDTEYEFDEGVSPKIFNDLDAVFCGDIHNRFVLANNIQKPIIMVGSFLQQDYRENLLEHGYCVFKVSDGTYSFTNIEGKVQYMTFKITDFEDIKDGTEKLLNK